MRTTLAAVLFAALLSTAAWPEEVRDSLILTNVNVIDTRTGVINYHMTVVVAGDHIRAVAKIGLLQLGKKIRVINTNGKYLIPGLWDMHVHSAGGPAPPWDENIILPLYIANGVTGIRDMGGNPALLEQRRDRIENGALAGPHIVFAGPFLDGGKPEDPNHPDPQFLYVNTPDEARSAVRALSAAHRDFVKVLDGIPRDAYFALADESTRLKIPFAGHVPLAVSALEASTSGQRSIEHLSGIMLACSGREGELRARELQAVAKQDGKAFAAIRQEILSSYDDEKARSLFTQFAVRNTYQTPTLSWWQAVASASDLAAASDPRLQYVPAWARSAWLPSKPPDPAIGGAYKQLFTRYIELARTVHRSGVPFLAGTDGPDPFVFPGFSLHDELALLVKAGFTNTEALQTATFYPALFLTRLDRYGVIEPGHFADMVLLEANPLDDIHNTRRISAVVLRGKYYSRKDLDTMLSEVQGRAKNSLKAEK
jgi:hypothetical protein